MLAYKGFNKDMTCRGFQFEEGKEYREEKAELCESGFHACENPLDCFDYYSPAESVYHEVELDELSDRKSDDSKICGKHIKIGARLSVAKICRLHFEFIKSMCTNENNAEKGKAATAGDYGAATSRGRTVVGENGAALARGNNVRVKGGLGAILVIAEESKDDYDIIEWKAEVVDGKKIKPDTWYKLENGEFVEVEETS